MSVNTDFTFQVPLVSATNFTPSALQCPLSLKTMEKVSTLLCGHSYEEAKIQNVFDENLLGQCPVCHQITQRVPSNEILQQMINQAAVRTALQRACNTAYLAHPEAEDKAGEDEDAATSPTVAQEFRAAKNRPHLSSSAKNLQLGELSKDFEETGPREFSFFENRAAFDPPQSDTTLKSRGYSPFNMRTECNLGANRTFVPCPNTKNQ